MIILSYYILKERMNYNGGQKSWDKFTFVAFFHTCQTNSQARIHLHIFSRFPPPPTPSTMLDTCTRYFSRGSTLYGGGGEGKKQRILKRKTVLFQNSVLNTEKISAITQVSQGILSTIVWFSRLMEKCTIMMFFSPKCI